MGEPRLVHPGLIAALLALVPACGGEAELWATANVTAEIYGSGAGGGGYRHSSADPAVRGSIRGKITFEGRPYRQGKLELTEGYCTHMRPEGILSEDFRFGPDGSLGGVIVYVKRGLSRLRFETPSEPLVLDQHGCQYVPHLLVLQTGQPLIIKSSDDTLHNVRGADGPNKGFNFSQSKPSELPPLTFAKPEVAKRVGCDVHGWMVSWLAILPHPCWAVTAEDGTYAIEGVPPGKYLLGFWHERLGEFEQEVELGPKETKTVNYVMRRR